MTKKKIEGGATLWARKTIESEIFSWKPDKWFKIWFYIISKVNWKDGPILKRGQGYFTYKEIMNGTEATRFVVDHCIRYLKRATMIATRKATRGMVISVLNYDRYQTVGTYKSDTKSESKSDIAAIQARYSRDTISKERKKGNKGIKKDPPLPPALNGVEIIIIQWNEFAEKYGLAQIKGIEKKTQRHSYLNARMKSKGFDFKALLTMIENSPFLLAQTKAGFRVFFDWIIKPTNYQKVIEGTYLDKKKETYREYMERKKHEEGEK